MASSGHSPRGPVGQGAAKPLVFRSDPSMLSSHSAPKSARTASEKRGNAAADCGLWRQLGGRGMNDRVPGLGVEAGGSTILFVYR